MRFLNELERAGLSKGESVIYSSLISLKIASVKDVAAHTGFHRPNIYDIIEKLKEKGLVSSYNSGKTHLFKCSDPENLNNYLDEKRDAISQMMPELKQLYAESKEPIDIEILKGRNGMISAYKDILRTGKTLYGFGLSGKFKATMPVFRDQFLSQAKQRRIKIYLIYSRPAVPKTHNTETRYLQSGFDSPMEVLIYGDNTLQAIWEPEMTAIIIRSIKYSRTYKRYFDILWKQAKPKMHRSTRSQASHQQAAPE